MTKQIIAAGITSLIAAIVVCALFLTGQTPTPIPQERPVAGISTVQEVFGEGIQLPNKGGGFSGDLDFNSLHTIVSSGSCNIGTTTRASLSNPFGAAADVITTVINVTTASGKNFGVYTATTSANTRFSTSSLAVPNRLSTAGLLQGANFPGGNTGTVSNHSTTTAYDTASSALPLPNAWVASSTDVNSIGPIKPILYNASTTRSQRVGASEYFNIVTIPRYGVYSDTDALRCDYKVVWQKAY